MVKTTMFYGDDHELEVYTEGVYGAVGMVLDAVNGENVPDRVELDLIAELPEMEPDEEKVT